MNWVNLGRGGEIIQSCQNVHLQEIFCRVANVVVLSTLLKIALVLNTWSILMVHLWWADNVYRKFLKYMLLNPFSSNVSLVDKPGSWFLLAKCLKNTCERVAS